MSNRQSSDLVIASILFLMSSYCKGNANDHMQDIIRRHFDTLCDCDDLGEPLAQMCDQLSSEWRAQPRSAAAHRKSHQLRLVS